MSSEARLYPLGTLADYRFVVMLSRMDGQFLLSRHRARTTWQNQGGHIEPGETPIEAARRELFEESGALDYDIAPLCDYQFPHGAAMVFTANIRRLGQLPESEIAQTRLFDAMPAELTYPYESAELLEYAARTNAFAK